LLYSQVISISTGDLENEVDLLYIVFDYTHTLNDLYKYDLSKLNRPL